MVDDDEYPPQWLPIRAVLTDEFESSPEELADVLEKSSTYDHLVQTYSDDGIDKVDVKKKLKLRIIDGVHRVLAASGTCLKHFRVRVYKHLPPEGEALGERVGQGLLMVL